MPELPLRALPKTNALRSDARPRGAADQRVAKLSRDAASVAVHPEPPQQEFPFR